jgi:hypothetical protein
MNFYADPDLENPIGDTLEIHDLHSSPYYIIYVENTRQVPAYIEKIQYDNDAGISAIVPPEWWTLEPEVIHVGSVGALVIHAKNPNLLVGGKWRFQFREWMA